MVALGVLMAAAIATGLVYTLSRSEQSQVGRRAVASALHIESTPPGAAVFVGGEPTGLKTPTTLTGLATNQLVIRLELPGHSPATRAVDVPTGDAPAIQMTLAPLLGRLVISDLPPNAGVIVDTEEYQAGEVIPVAAGYHEVHIVVAGRTVTRQSIETAGGDQSWKLVRDKLVRK